MSALDPSRDSLATIRDDGTRRFVHPADVRGAFTRWRTVSGWALIALYAALPFVKINGYPAVFFDLAKRQFHLFGLTLVAQDLWLAFFLVTGLAFALFFLTALWGRLWCGWACPQTVFVEHIFRRIERWIEGDALARRRLDDAPWTRGKVLRRGGKLAAFAVVALAVAHVFMAYFVSVPGLYNMMTRSPLENAAIFGAVAALAGLIMFDFAWFREQFCIILCPYGRFQSALIDDNSIVIGYDTRRGEPRGKAGAPGAGDCIDCHRCVAVCPTGIDIRQGLQLECVSCANCVDACDEVMDRLKRPRGLVRHDSMNALSGAPTRVLRPRLFVYTALLLVGAAVAANAFAGFRTATVSALRMPGAPYYLDGGNVRNQYLVRVINKRNEPARFTLRTTAAQALAVSGADTPVAIAPLGEQLRPVVVTVPADEFKGTFTIRLEVVPETGGSPIPASLPFLGPDR